MFFQHLCDILDSSTGEQNEELAAVTKQVIIDGEAIRFSAAMRRTPRGRIATRIGTNHVLTSESCAMYVR